jgi:hypothetical protein
MNFNDFLPKHINLDAEIKKLGKTVASIREEINNSPAGNVFDEGKNLTPDRKQQLRSRESELQDA